MGTSRAGQAGGGSFKTLLHNTPSQHSFTSTSLQHLSSTTLYYKVLLQYYSVLQSTTRTERRPSSTTPCYKVLLRQNDVHPVLLRTTKYYKVLLRQNDVHPCPSSATPVLLCTTKYYSSTPQYYKLLLQYYSLLQSTTRTERRPSSTTPYYKVLLGQNDVHPVL